MSEQKINSAEETIARGTSYKDSLKSMDTEEHIDLWFYRPIGYAWARLAAKIGVTPNMITIASIFLGIGAGYCFFFNDLRTNVIGMLLLIWANSYDSADGQLARMTGQYSRLGRILDGLAGDIWFFSIYFGICMRMTHGDGFFGEYKWAIWIIAATAGFFHAKQASMADYYRQFHLFFLKGKSGSELENGNELKDKLNAMPWRGHIWARLTLMTYLNYTTGQEKMTPNMQKLRRELYSSFGNGEISQSFRDDFRSLSLPLMKFTNILSFNWRVITLFITLFIGMPWLYFVVELTVFNTILLYMVKMHEKICAVMTDKLQNGDYGN